MNEKEAIEKETADAFLEFYNDLFGTNYSVVEYGDAPDVRCKDKNTNEVLNLEITLTEDRPGDLPAALGRSNHKNLDAVKKQLAKVREGKISIFSLVNCLQTNVSEILIQRVKAKSLKDYGANTALIIRDSSGVEWDWESTKPLLIPKLEKYSKPFTKGIWIVSRYKNKIVKLI